MLEFLIRLFATGDLIVPREEDLSGVEDLLTQAEVVWRDQLPGTPPQFHSGTAASAARVLLRLAQAIVDRSVEVSDVRRGIEDSGLQFADDSTVFYSVDLVLRFLPQLAERAARISQADELLTVITAVGKTWPLSSIGMRDCQPDEIPLALKHPTLWRIYIDRVLETGDKTRLADPRVRQAVEAACGPFPEFAKYAPSQSQLRQP